MELLNILLLLSFTLLVVVILLFILALFCYFPPSCPILLSMGLRRKNKNTVSQTTNGQMEVSKSDSNGFYEIPLKGGDLPDRANKNEEQQSASSTDVPEIVLTTASMKMRRL